MQVPPRDAHGDQSLLQSDLRTRTLAPASSVQLLRVHNVDAAVLKRNVERFVELDVLVDRWEAVLPGLRADSQRAEVLDLGGCVVEDQQ